MRRALRLLPLPLGIAICLPALADEKPVNWNLCPATDVLPAFDDAPKALFDKVYQALEPVFPDFVD